MSRNMPQMVTGSMEKHIANGLMFKCDTLEELADKTHVPALPRRT